MSGGYATLEEVASGRERKEGAHDQPEGPVSNPSYEAVPMHPGLQSSEPSPGDMGRENLSRVLKDRRCEQCP